jgi:RHS repeat-associated protein
MTNAAAKGRSLLFLAAAFALCAAILAAPAAEATRTLPALAEPAQATQRATLDALEDATPKPPIEPEKRLRLFEDLSWPTHPLELVQISKTASGVFDLGLDCNILKKGGLSQECGSPSFQGLWHDPTTGLAYARNRWYDARTASWLSEDPLGPVDSPNLYAFVAWGPHAARDPLGKQGGAFFAVMMADNIIDGGRAEAVDTWNGLVDMAEGIPAWLRDDAKAERLEAYEEGGYEAYKAVLERQSGMTAEQLLSLVPFRRAGLLLKDLPRKFREEGPVAVEQAIGRALFSGGTDAAGVYGTYKVIAGPKAAPNPTVAWAERMSRVPGDEIPSSGLGKFDGFGDVKTSPWLRDPRLAVRSHIEDFRQGGSFLVPESLYRRFVEGQAVVGRESGLFITTRGAMDKLIAETGGDLAAISKRLGTTWSEPLYRVDVHNPLLHNARLPSGLEAGADPLLFRWGGYTSGGMPELAVDPVPAGGFSATRVP